jgi:hypothetical protein
MIFLTQGETWIRTDSGEILLSGLALPPHALVAGVSIKPSMITWATWTPFGPTSLASDWPNARIANFPAANDENWDEALRDAVAPVMTNVGGDGASETESSNSGRIFWAKLKKPPLG